MSTDQQSILAFYTRPGLITEPGEFRPYYQGLPPDLPSLVQVVQGLIVHIFWAYRQGLELSEARKAEVHLRTVPRQLQRLLQLNDAPLTVPRPLDQKLVGNCRDFSVLLTSMLRCCGFPARARAGFGTYFTPGRYEDHWVCEVWDDALQRWKRVDAQLDKFQQMALRFRFDPLDLPQNAFWTGSRAWLACRTGERNPQKFGIFDMHGMGFVLGDLIRDFLALNSIEILPWDPWPVFSKEFHRFTPAELEFFDQMAILAEGGDSQFDARAALIESNPLLQVPPGYQP